MTTGTGIVRSRVTKLVRTSSSRLTIGIVHLPDRTKMLSRIFLLQAFRSGATECSGVGVLTMARQGCVVMDP